MPRRHPMTLAVTALLVLYTVNGIDRVCLSIAMPTMGEQYHFSAIEKGVLFSSFFWTYSGAQLPAGLLIDRILPSLVVTGAATLWGLASMSSGLVIGFWSLLASRLALGLCEAPFMPAANTIVSNLAAGSTRRTAVTIIDSGAAFGAAAGALAGGAILRWSGSWRASFIFTGAAGVIAAFAAAYPLRKAESTAPAPRPLRHKTDMMKKPHMPGFGLNATFMCIGRIAFANVFFGLVSWAPSLFMAHRGTDIGTAGVITGVIFLGGALGEVTGGAVFAWLWSRLPFRLAFRLLIAFSGTIAIICMLLSTRLDSLALITATLSIGLFFLMFGGIYWLVPEMISANGRLGLMSGILNFSGTLGGVSAGLVSGAVVAHWGYTLLPDYYIGCLLIYVLFSQLIAPLSAPNDSMVLSSTSTTMSG